MDDERTIERELKAGDISIIDAIERMEKIGYSCLHAEEKVYAWSEEAKKLIEKK